jgi:hypothetical protein
MHTASFGRREIAYQGSGYARGQAPRYWTDFGPKLVPKSQMFDFTGAP